LPSTPFLLSSILSSLLSLTFLSLHSSTPLTLSSQIRGPLRLLRLHDAPRRPHHLHQIPSRGYHQTRSLTLSPLFLCLSLSLSPSPSTSISFLRILFSFFSSLPHLSHRRHTADQRRRDARVAQSLAQRAARRPVLCQISRPRGHHSRIRSGQGPFLASRVSL